MHKIKDNIIQKFYRMDLSTIEQLIFRELIYISDENGVIKNNYYKEIIENTGCSTAQYYRAIKKLENKRLIDKIKNTKDIVIIGNDFDDTKRFKKFTNFCDLNFVLYESREYKQLRAGSRRLLEYFIFRIFKQRKKAERYNSLKYVYKNRSLIHSYQLIKNEVFNGKLSLRMFKIYIKELIKFKFISIGHGIDTNQNKYDIITVLATKLQTPTIEITEKGKRTTKKRNSKHKHYVHILKNYLRQNKIESDTLNINNVAEFFTQYEKKAKENKKNIYQIIKTAINNFTLSALDSKIVHAIVKKLLAKDYNASLIVY